MRAPIIKTTIAAFMLAHSPATAQVTAPASVIAGIEADGYTITDIARSWLGRIVITARNDAGLREVVLNRTSGEVLRDHKFPTERAGPPQAGIDKPDGPDKGRGGAGGRGGSGPGGG